MASYIPATDAEFHVWAQNLVTKVASEPAVYGLKPETVTALQATEATFDTSFSGAMQQRDAAKGAVILKNQSRKQFEEMIRTVVRQIQANPDVPDSEKVEAGLPVHDNQPSPMPFPTNSPTALITASALRNVIRFADPNHPTRSYRPRGVMSIEIIAHIGDTAPVSMAQYLPLGVATRMIHPITFGVEDGGKSIWYRFRWIGTRGEVGSWSDSFSATIWK